MPTVLFFDDALKDIMYWAHNDEHRLIYDVKENIIAVKSCRGHYDDK